MNSGFLNHWLKFIIKPNIIMPNKSLSRSVQGCGRRKHWKCKIQGKPERRENYLPRLIAAVHLQTFLIAAAMGHNYENSALPIQHSFRVSRGSTCLGHHVTSAISPIRLLPHSWLPLPTTCTLSEGSATISTQQPDLQPGRGKRGMSAGHSRRWLKPTSILGIIERNLARMSSLHLSS